MQSGEIFVSGEDFCVIQLHGNPAKVVAFFHDHCTFVPCNPGSADSLYYEVVGLLFTISWNVSGVRDIRWHVYY
jgi:hypothetical protein